MKKTFEYSVKEFDLCWKDSDNPGFSIKGSQTGSHCCAEKHHRDARWQALRGEENSFSRVTLTPEIKEWGARSRPLGCRRVAPVPAVHGSPVTVRNRAVASG